MKLSPLYHYTLIATDTAEADVFFTAFINALKHHLKTSPKSLREIILVLTIPAELSVCTAMFTHEFGAPAHRRSFRVEGGGPAIRTYTP